MVSVDLRHEINEWLQDYKQYGNRKTTLEQRSNIILQKILSEDNKSTILDDKKIRIHKDLKALAAAYNVSTEELVEVGSVFNSNKNK